MKEKKVFPQKKKKIKQYIYDIMDNNIKTKKKI